MNLPDPMETTVYDACDACGCIPCACEDIATERDTERDTLACGACGAPAVLLGVLGWSTWYRCTACGVQVQHTDPSATGTPSSI